MKIIYLSLLACVLTAASPAQVFWSEDFGTGCNTGNPAAGFTTANGPWSMTDVAPPATYANQWYISAHTRNTGVGTCADDCVGGNNQTLHVGNVAIPLLGLAAEAGSYLTGFYCGLGFCSTTHRRVETPVIDCTGKSGITLSCIYFEGGDVPGGTNGDCSIWFYDGITWTMIDALAKTNNAPCSGTIYGVWTSYSISLPVSADNNPNVKLGFQWDNDDVSVGSDPSAAFDDIELSTATAAAPVSGFTVDITSGCDSVCVTFTDTSQGGTSRVWSFPGGTPSTSTSATQLVCYNAPGSYDVTMISSNSFGSDTTSQTGYVEVSQTPLPDFSVSDQSLCVGDCVTFTDLTSGPVLVYTWTFAGGFPLNSNQQNPAFICYQNAGDFSVTLTVENGGCTNSITRVAFMNVHQAATPVVTLSGDTLISTPALTYQWYELSGGAIGAGIFQNYIVTQTGDYFVCVQDAFGCSACSDTIYVDPSSVHEIRQAPFSIYPVPANEMLIIKTNKSHVRQVSILDVMGKQLFKTETDPAISTKNIDVHQLASGIYWIELASETEVYRMKFVKQ